MKQNLDYYTKTFKLLNDDICKRTIEEIEKLNWDQHIFYNTLDKTSIHLSGDKELDVAYGQCSTKKDIMQSIWQAYYNYVEELNFPWFDGWSGFSEVRFNRYRETTLMAEHCDHITTLFDGERKGIPTLTALGSLNDDYEGGELVFFQDQVVSLKAGEILVFPSCFLFPHRVEPVTKGIRYSFVSWAW
jgi:hypothetical protein